MDDSIHAESRIGHVHLKVSDLDRSEAFYREVVGFEVTMRGEGLVFMSAGCSPSRFLFPRHVDLVHATRRAEARGVRFHRASDYGYSLAVYMRHPDGNEIELAWDRDSSAWPRNVDGTLRRTPAQITPEEALTLED